MSVEIERGARMNQGASSVWWFMVFGAGFVAGLLVPSPEFRSREAFEVGAIAGRTHELDAVPIGVRNPYP